MQRYQCQQFQLSDYLSQSVTASPAVSPRVGSPSAWSTQSSLSETSALSDEGTVRMQGSESLTMRTHAFLKILASTMSEGAKAHAIRTMLPHADEEIQRCFRDADLSPDMATGQHSWKQISAALQSLVEQKRKSHDALNHSTLPSSSPAPPPRSSSLLPLSASSAVSAESEEGWEVVGKRGGAAKRRREKMALRSLDTSTFPKDKFPQALLFPQNLEAQKRMEEESVGGYLAFCKINLLAEFWMMLKQQVSYGRAGSSGNPQAGWIRKNLKKLRFVTVGKDKATLDVLPNTEKASLPELLGVCVIVNGRLGITSPRLQCLCGDDSDDTDDDDNNVKICDGKHSSPADCKGSRWVDVKLGAKIETIFGGEDREYDATQKKCVYSFGSIRDFVVGLNAIECITEHAAAHADGSEASECDSGCCVTRVCETVADPSKRVESALVPLTRIPEDIDLNEEQRECLLGLRYSVEAVQGPPGTGKTTLIHAAVHAVSAQHPTAVILVACVQNQAIENLALRFATTEQALSFVVLAQRSNDRLGLCARHWALDSQVDRDPTVVKAQAWYEAAKAQYNANRAQYNECRDSRQARREQITEARSVMNEAWTSLQKTKLVVRVRLVASARVVLTTITSSTQWLREAKVAKLKRGVDCMIVDEAGNAPDAQMPQLLLHTPQLLLLVGDHKQLPPFARVGGAPPVSLLERVFLKLKDAAPTLTRQYRMHPRICNFVSQAFYSGRLTTDPSLKHAELDPDTPGLFQGIVLDLYDSHQAGAETREGTSYWNYTEVMKTMLAVRRVAAVLPACKSMAVVSFYKAHVSHLQAQVAAAPALQALVDGQRLRILSVDACQGSEADVVILNCVRSLPRSASTHPLSFFGNKHRFCVATSRAKHLLLVVGCSSTFKKQARFFQHVQLLSTKRTAVRASTAGSCWQLSTFLESDANPLAVLPRHSV